MLILMIVCKKWWVGYDIDIDGIAYFLDRRKQTEI